MVSFGDAVLKPQFQGRGVDVMLLIKLLGAIGGMLTSGIVGLFVGATILALRYNLLYAWLYWQGPAAGEALNSVEPGASNT